MRYPPFVALLFLVTHSVYAQIGSHLIPGSTTIFKDTTGALNQVTRPQDEKVIDQQQQQEDMYLSDLEREEKESQQQDQDIDQYRYDEEEENNYGRFNPNTNQSGTQDHFRGLKPNTKM